MTEETIYVRLLNEDMNVWRPVAAKQIGPIVFRISSNGAPPLGEEWEFVGGQLVEVEERVLEGSNVRVAVRCRLE